VVRAEQVFSEAILAEPNLIDPGVSIDGQGYRVIRSIYDPLVYRKVGTFELIPYLAESWEESDDGLTYTFHLREGVKFHDGTPFDAEAAKFSFDRVLTLNQSPASFLSDLREEDPFQVVDDHTLAIYLKAKNRFFTQALPQVFMVSPAAVEEHTVGDDNATEWLGHNGVGTGPYKFERWDLAQQTVLVRNADWWRGWGDNYLDRIVLRSVPETATMIELLLSGEVQMIDTVEPANIEALKNNPEVKLDFGLPITVNHITMKTVAGPLKDKKVREVLYYAFPYEKVRDVVFNGYSELSTGPLGAALMGYREGPEIVQDLEKARQLLSETEFADGGLKLTYAPTPTPSSVNMGVVFQEELRNLGIELEVTPMPWAQLVQTWQDVEQSPDMSILIMTPATGDAAFLMRQNFACSNAGGPWNWSYYCNEEVDRLLAESVAADSDAEMEALLDRAVDLVMADYPTIFATSPPSTVHALRENVEGFVYEAGDYTWTTNFWDMHLRA
jgi:peptide/nickel transport system substrate-binding protein